MLWLDGRVTALAPVPFDLRDRGLLLADGLFETMLVVGGVAFRLDEHLARLHAGAGVLRLPVDLDAAGQAVRDLSRCLEGPGVVRVTVTRGAGARGLRLPEAPRPLLFATAAPWSPDLAFQPQRLALSAIRRNETSPLSRVKSLAYLDNVLALDAAVAAGADDALLLSTRGNVACTSAANVFVLRGTRLQTPPAEDGILSGITRAALLALAGRCGLEAVEASMTPADLHDADAVFTANSVRLITPVSALDGMATGDAQSSALGGLWRRLRDLIAAECGSDLGWRPTP